MLAHPAGILGLVLGILLAISGLLGGVWVYGERRYVAGEADGKAALAASLNKQVDTQAAAAEAARQAALAPGAAARLKAAWCRDCIP